MLEHLRKLVHNYANKQHQQPTATTTTDAIKRANQQKYNTPAIQQPSEYTTHVACTVNNNEATPASTSTEQHQLVANHEQPTSTHGRKWSAAFATVTAQIQAFEQRVRTNSEKLTVADLKLLTKTMNKNVGC